MERDVYELIRLLYISGEVVMEFELSIGSFNTLEATDNIVILHNFETDDFESSFYFSDLEYKDQLKIFKMLTNLLYN